MSVRVRMDERKRVRGGRERVRVSNSDEEKERD